jgi:hypothetical protein
VGSSGARTSRTSAIGLGGATYIVPSRYMAVVGLATNIDSNMKLCIDLLGKNNLARAGMSPVIAYQEESEV